MINYIKTINKERRQLPRNLRVATDLLGLVSIAVGYFILTNTYKHCFWREACTLLQNNEILFWSIFPIAFILAITVGQFLVLGLFSLCCVVLGKLSIKEGLRYSVLYRMPKKWLNKSA